MSENLNDLLQVGEIVYPEAVKSKRVHDEPYEIVDCRPVQDGDLYLNPTSLTDGRVRVLLAEYMGEIFDNSLIVKPLDCLEENDDRCLVCINHFRHLNGQDCISWEKWKEQGINPEYIEQLVQEHRDGKWPDHTGTTQLLREFPPPTVESPIESHVDDNENSIGTIEI